MKIFARAFLCGPELDPNEMKASLAASNPGFMIQTTGAGAAKNERLVEMLAAQTLQAGSKGSLLAEKPEIDFLLRLAGTTQISRAIEEQGAKTGAPFLLVIAGYTRVVGTPELDRLELPRHELSADDLARVEKGALLNARKA